MNLRRKVRGVRYLLVLTVLVACGSEAKSIDGTVTIGTWENTDLSVDVGDPCGGQAVHGGIQVVVTDQSNDVLATGTLGDGVVVRGERDLDCAFPLHVGDVPGDAEFYRVAVGTLPSVTYSRSELDGADWKVSLKG